MQNLKYTMMHLSFEVSANAYQNSLKRLTTALYCLLTSKLSSRNHCGGSRLFHSVCSQNDISVEEKMAIQYLVAVGPKVEILTVYSLNKETKESIKN